MSRHEFGGIWTRKKLEYLKKYLSIFTTALKYQKFNLHYVDAFAGTGKQSAKLDDMQESFLPDEDMEGSVKIALECEPSFHQYHFNDLDNERVNALEALKVQYPDKNISVTQQDANEFVIQFCSNMEWNDRAVLFLDPFSTELDWQTLTYVAESGKIDLWLLFPLSVILRMTPTDGDNIKPQWQDTLNRLLGTYKWQETLYRESQGQQDIFANESSSCSKRVNVEELTAWVKDRLENNFTFVGSPIHLSTSNNTPLFLFFFAVSSKRKKAVALARKLAKEALNI